MSSTSTDQMNIYNMKTHNRVRLFLVDELPKDMISSFVTNLSDLFDKYDEDVVKGMLERSPDYNLSNENLIYSENYKNYNLEFIYFANAAKLTMPHLILALAKYPNAQITLFLSTKDEIENRNPLSIIDKKNLTDLNVENIRQIRPNKRKHINLELDAKKILEQLQDEISSIKSLCRDT